MKYNRWFQTVMSINFFVHFIIIGTTTLQNMPKHYSSARLCVNTYNISHFNLLTKPHLYYILYPQDKVVRIIKF